MSIFLKKLPYNKKDLEPYISAKTIKFHYEKHHRGYVEKTNALIKGSFAHIS
jgi:Fe-Mn family superoxide dismutase